MKKLLVLFLFIPLISFSQTYKDVMSIKSLDIFKKVAIENNYEYSPQSTDNWISYGYNIQKDSIDGDKSSRWMFYEIKEERFGFSFSKSSFFGATDNTEYDRIYAVVKDKCTYFKILNYYGDDYVCYSCPESTYKGKIGFMIEDEQGFIRTFPESKSIATSLHLPNLDLYINGTH